MKSFPKSTLTESFSNISRINRASLRIMNYSSLIDVLMHDVVTELLLTRQVKIPLFYKQDSPEHVYAGGIFVSGNILSYHQFL